MFAEHFGSKHVLNIVWIPHRLSRLQMECQDKILHLMQTIKGNKDSACETDMKQNVATIVVMFIYFAVITYKH